MEILGGQVVALMVESQGNRRMKEIRLVLGYQTSPEEPVDSVVEIVQENRYRGRHQEAALEVEVQTKTGRVRILQTYQAVHQRHQILISSMMVEQAGMAKSGPRKTEGAGDCGVGGKGRH
jgi:predicted ArsR family transcriptional regulator